jgi:hypothetical protein
VATREAGTLPVELVRYILAQIAPGEFRISHVWTPELDLVILRPSRQARRRFKKKDFEAIVLVVEKICERAGRPAVVEVQ